MRSVRWRVVALSLTFGALVAGGGMLTSPASAALRHVVRAAPGVASGAVVRVVNLTRLGSQSTSIVVFDSTTAQKGQQPIATLVYGSVSAPLRPHEDDSGAASTTLSFYRPGAPTAKTLLGQWTETVHTGDQLTVVVEPNDDDPHHIPVFTSIESEHGGTTPLPAATPGKALLFGHGYGLPKSSTTRFGVQYGIVGHGCLTPSPDSAGAVHYVGGTDTVAFSLDPGPQPIAVYTTDDQTCSKRPLAAPVTLNSQAGGRVYLFTYGTPHHPLKVLLVPVPTP